MDEYVCADSTHIVLPELKLLSNKTFILKSANKEVVGNWDAEDGDHTWINFYLNSKHPNSPSGEHIGQGIIGGERGELIIIDQMVFPPFKSITFKKVEEIKK